tara:strand:+ start:597 stop:4013 length:3417 start_codon:yes stop_codon:yes gene_type:complete
MDVTKEQENEFYALRKEAALNLSKQTLKDNPNITYGDLLSPKELEFAAHQYSPVVKTRAAQIYTPEQIEQINNSVNWSERVAPYNRAPIEYDMYERHPEYQRRLDEYNVYQEALAKEPTVADLTAFPDAFNPLDQREIDERIKPSEPFGLSKQKEIATLGFDPSPENQIQFQNPGDARTFNLGQAFGPRKMTMENYKFLGDKVGLKGEYRYINPSKPQLGVAFKAEGEEDFKIINSPQITAEDTYKLLTQEAPALVGDIGVTAYAAYKLSTPAGLAGGILAKGGKVLALSGAAAIGAAGGDFLRLLAGYQMGAHDLEPAEMLKEAGVIGAWAFAGTAGISLSSQAIMKVWKMVTKTDVPPGILEQIDDSLQASKQTDTAGPGLLYGDEVSVQQIRKQIGDLTDKYGADFGKGYNPTMPTQAGTQSAADLEAVFLKYADDPELRELYGQVKAGNQEVIDEFVRTLNEKIGPSTTGLDDATGATLSEGLRVLVQKDIDMFNDEAYGMLDQVRRQVGGAEDSAAAGNALLKKVDNPQASSGPVFDRQQTRLAQIRTDYVKPFNEAWNNALNNPRYVNLKTGAGYTRAPAQKWLNARKGEANKLFRSSQGDEAVRELYNLLPSNSKNTINRLRGMGDTKFENPGFTLDELNTARVSLNDFSSNLPDGKKGIAKLARELERGIEDQMNFLVREGAARESGIPITQKVKLNKWIDENKYGDDLRQAWSSQKEALELSNSVAVRSILQQRPEKVADYLLDTTVKGSKQNKTVTDLMTLLKRDGSEEVLEIQEGLAAYIQREVLDAPDLKPLQIAKKYRQFVKDNEGTLKAVFGEKDFVSRFNNPKGFNKIIKQIENTNQNIAQLQARFGLAEIGEPDKVVTNIVESILATGKTQKQSGRILQDIEYLATITKNNPELKEQIAQVTKRYLLQDIITARPGGGFKIDNEGLNKLIKEGFGPEEVTGPRLTFESFISPLLGKKEGKEFIKNLTILDNMVQREVGVEASEGIQRIISGGEYVVGNNLEGARMLQRLLIAPLTQTGRRITAISTRQAENSRKLIGRMLLDPELFEQVMRMAQGRESTQKMIRILTSYGMVAANDIGNEMKYYDTTDKAQKTPEPETSALDDLRSNAPLGVPDRLLNLLGA